MCKVKFSNEAATGFAGKAAVKAPLGVHGKSPAQSGPPLSEELADAVCTAIVIGYIKQYNNEHKGHKATFEYNDPKKDAATHEEVQSRLLKAGADCVMRTSAKADVNRIIFAGRKMIDLRSNYSTEAQYSSLYHLLNLRAEQFAKDYADRKGPPKFEARGAYMGAHLAVTG